MAHRNVGTVSNADAASVGKVRTVIIGVAATAVQPAVQVGCQSLRSRTLRQAVGVGRWPTPR